MSPRVTVLMPVHNAAATVAEALRSILDQTYRDLEILVIDDGSTDGTAEIAAAQRDARVRIERNTERAGLPGALNAGLAFARGEYVARMDADDVSLPARIQRQVAFMEAHPEVGASGAWARVAGHRAGRVWRRPTADDDAAATLLFGTPFIHPTVMLRWQAFVDHDLRYDASLMFAAEDWDLWLRANDNMRFANLPEVLLLYNVRPPMRVLDAEARRHRDGKRADHQLVVARSLRRIGLPDTDENVRLHAAVCLLDPPPDDAFLERVEDHLLRALRSNEMAQVYPREALRTQVALQWFAIAEAHARRGGRAWARYWASPLATGRTPSLAEIVRFVLVTVASLARPRV